MASSSDDNSGARKGPSPRPRSHAPSIREADLRQSTACIRRAALMRPEPTRSWKRDKILETARTEQPSPLPPIEPMRIETPEDDVKQMMTLREVQDRHRRTSHRTRRKTHRPTRHGSDPHRCRPSFFAVLFAAASTMIIANSPPMDKLIMALQKDNATARASTFDTYRSTPLFIPLFGPQAVEACTAQCRLQHGEDTCSRACQKLSLSEYARRIRLADSSPEADADRIQRSCVSNDEDRTNFSTADQWESAVRSASQTVSEMSARPPTGDFARSRLALDRLRATMFELQYPPTADRSFRDRQTATREVLEASCLRAHHALTELAVILADQNKDGFSVRYYADLARRIGKSATEADQQASKDVQLSLSRKPER